MARIVQLRCRSQTSRAAAHNRHLLSASLRRRFRDDPAALPAHIYDRAFDVLDRHWRGVDAQHAGTLAWSRASAASKLREVVGLVQLNESCAPIILRKKSKKINIFILLKMILEKHYHVTSLEMEVTCPFE